VARFRPPRTDSAVGDDRQPDSKAESPPRPQHETNHQPVHLSLAAGTAVAADALPKVASKFEVTGHTAYLFAAPKPAEGKPWV
jgi:hypothetical protein